MSQPTNLGHGFCGECGVPLPGPVKFCPSCGHVQLPAARPGQAAPPASWQPPPPPAYAPPATPPSYEQLDWSQPQRQQPPRSRRALLVVGGLVLLLVAGGSVAAVLLLGGNDSRLLGGGSLVGAVTEEPEEQWSWSTSGTMFGGVAVGDVLVVGSDGDEGVTALDEDGEELWTSEVGGYPYAYAGQDDVVFVSPLEGEGAEVLSVETGEELWSFDNGYVSRATEKGLVRTTYDDDQTLDLLDAKTGDELWSVPAGDSFTVTDDAAYVLDGSELTRLSLDSGEEEWSIGTDFRADDESYVWLAATDDMVVLSDGDVVAFDAESGDELWTEGGSDGTEVGAFSATRVYLLQSEYTDDEMLTEVTVYDRDGRVGDLDLDPEDYFSGQPFESDGDEYNLDYSEGRLYNEELEEIGRYDGTLALVDGGLYTHEEDGELSFYELGSGSPTWSIDGPVSDSEEYGASLVPFDGRLVVVTADEVVSYK